MPFGPKKSRFSGPTLSNAPSIKYKVHNMGLRYIKLFRPLTTRQLASPGATEYFPTGLNYPPPPSFIGRMVHNVKTTSTVHLLIPAMLAAEQALPGQAIRHARAVTDSTTSDQDSSLTPSPPAKLGSTPIRVSTLAFGKVKA